MLKNILNAALGMLIIALVVIVAMLYQDQPKTAYADNDKILLGFDMFTEKNKELESVMNMRKNQLDSTRVQLESFQRYLQSQAEPNPVEVANFQNQAQQFQMRQQQFEEDNQKASQQYLKQITEQVDTYIKEYCAREGFTYVYGATGDGSIIYADQGKNITQELIDYCNDRYRGK